MKRRSGFVSNSSSSSFIIKVDNKLTKTEDYEKIFKSFEFKSVILTPKQLSKYAEEHSTYMNMLLRNGQTSSYTIQNFLNDNIEYDTESVEYREELAEYIGKNSTQKVLDAFLLYEELKDELESHYNRDIDLSFSDKDYTKEEKDEILLKEFPRAAEFYKDYDEKDDWEISCTLSSIEEEFYIKKYLLEKINKWLDDNPGEYYSIFAEGDGNGWVSEECNGIHETSEDTVFNKEFLLKTYMD